jgi:hypothetical protein
MFFGRNEENGPRCVYHGWKFDRDGACVDMPSEPPDSLFKTKVRLDAYPAYEGGGIIWTYMGPPDRQPAAPDYELVRAPATHRFVSKSLEECNYLQALEGGLDTSHGTFLHKTNDGDITYLKNFAEIVQHGGPRGHGPDRRSVAGTFGHDRSRHHRDAATAARSHARRRTRRITPRHGPRHLSKRARVRSHGHAGPEVARRDRPGDVRPILMRRATLIGGSAALFVKGAGRARAADPIRLGMSSNEESALPYFAAEKGFFKEAGLDVLVTVFPPNQLLQGVLGGSLDMGTTNTGAIALAHVGRSSRRSCGARRTRRRSSSPFST